jgi:GNAT superfamily N-acetyltransferase
LVEEFNYNKAGLTEISASIEPIPIQPSNTQTILEQLIQTQSTPTPAQSTPLPVQSAPTQSPPEPQPVQTSVKIHRGGSDDIHAVTHLFVDYQRVFGETNPIFDKIEAFLLDKTENSGYTLFIAEKDGKPIAFAGLYPIYSSVTLRRQWLLNDFFVSQNYRKQGVGTALISEIKNSLSAGAQGIILITSDKNAEAKAFYEANGFSADGNLFYRVMF